jgi:hypothetical protein
MPYGTNQYQNVMTKAKKTSAPVVDLEKKEETIAAIKRAEEKLAKLRADIENDDNPDVTLFIVTCNEKTSEVSTAIGGSSEGMTTTLASVIEEDPDLRSVVAHALIISM